jgi:peptidoglycan hydrolase-like protein with peptidoglycan-binding domain
MQQDMGGQAPSGDMSRGDMGAGDMGAMDESGRGAAAAPTTGQVRCDQTCIKQLEQQLAQKGIYKGKVDGKWDSQLQQAVKQWQTRQGMSPTGQVDQQLLSSLNIQAAPSGRGAMQQPGAMQHPGGMGGSQSGGY